MAKSMASRADVTVTDGRREPRYARGLEEVGESDTPEVGVEPVTLAALNRALDTSEVRVSSGFVTGADARAAFFQSSMPLDPNGARGRNGTRATRETLAMALRRMLRVGRAKPADVADRCAIAKRLCLATPVPDPLRFALEQSYLTLCHARGADVAVAVRASACDARATGGSSSARGYGSATVVRGGRAVVDAWRRCVAGVYLEPSVIDLLKRGLDPAGLAISVAVTEMGPAAESASGTLSTLDPATGNTNVVVIRTVDGPGAANGDGAGATDLLLWKEGVRRGRCSVLGSGERIIQALRSGAGRNDRTSGDGERAPFGPSTPPPPLQELARVALVAEACLGGPVWMEWSQDARSGRIRVTWARPHASRAARSGRKRNPAVRARTGDSVPAGDPNVVALHLDVDDPGDAFALAMRRSAGVGLARLERIVTRDIGIHPLVLAHFEALSRLSCGGTLEAPLRPFADLVEGVGHAYLSEVVGHVRARVRDTSDAGALFVDAVRDGVARVCAAFHPRPVAVRLSDLPSSRYRALVGGPLFEAEEENPMIAWRGTARHVDPRFRPAFELECRALRGVLGLGLDNLQLVAPFCRTPEEGGMLRRLLENNALGATAGVPLHLRIELPANVILADDFIREMELAAGWIAVDDLVQTVYALSRSDLDGYTASIGASSPAVRWLITEVVERFRRRGLPIGVSGCARDTLGFVVERGVRAVSIAPGAGAESA